MITFLTGENSYNLQETLDAMRASFDGDIVVVDGSTLELRSIPDLLMGTSLFSTKRMVIIKSLSENKALWTGLIDWLPRLSEDVELVIVEPKPDKRTVTYKELKAKATVSEFPLWNERDTVKAEQWALDQSEKQGVVIDKKSVQVLVRRVGVDQWQLFHALEKLALAGEITPSLVEELIDAQPSENVFSLFELALKGDLPRLIELLRMLERSQDPYALFGLLSSQAFQLAAITVAQPTDAVAKDFGIHPYVVSKLQAIGKQRGKSGVRKIIGAFAKADDDLKVSKADPWVLIEQALLTVATL
jgi:DNA polymerase III delta subunit